MTSKLSRERPVASWRKEQERTPPLRRRLFSVSPRHLAPPEHIQILIGSLPGRHCLSPLNLEELYDSFPLSLGCLSGPQLYVEEHLLPAGDLPFQLDLQSVPPAQKETIHLLLGGFW